MGMAAMCDIRIASDRATFGELYIKRGTFASVGDCYYLPRIVGVAKAIELLLTGDSFDAQEAGRIGFVNKVVPHDELMIYTMDLARRIAKGPWSTWLYKRLVYRFMDMDLNTALEFNSWASLITDRKSTRLNSRHGYNSY